MTLARIRVSLSASLPAWQGSRYAIQTPFQLFQVDICLVISEVLYRAARGPQSHTV